MISSIGSKLNLQYHLRDCGKHSLCFEVYHKTVKVGTLVYCTRDDDMAGLYIQSIYVNEKWQRKYIGTFLIYLLAREAKRLRYWTIFLDNVLESTNLFYQKLGFIFTYFENGKPMDNEMHVKTHNLLQILENYEKLYCET